MQRIIDENRFYIALGKLDLLAVEVSDIRKKLVKIDEALTTIQQDLFSAVTEVCNQ